MKTKIVIKHKSTTKKILKLTVEITTPISKEFKAKEALARFRRNKEWLGEHLFNWAGFDYYFSITLFADMLEKLGQGLAEYNNCVLSQRCSRRAIYAAKELRSLQGREWWNDVSYKNWASRRTDYLYKTKGESYSTLSHAYLKDNAMGMNRKEYSYKMHKTIMKRIDKAYEERWTAIWVYIGKYIRHWWD